jgi:HEAT repeats
VNASTSWGKSPRESIEQECESRGKAAFVDGCIELLEGREANAGLIVALGGPPARWAGTDQRGGPDYWLRVWAARGLLWAWGDAALPSLMKALDDDAWRVREMAVKVVARHRLNAAFPAVADLQNDPVARVRAVASRAVARLANTGTVES